MQCSFFAQARVLVDLSSRRLFGHVYVWIGVRGLFLLCFRRDGGLISQVRGAALEAAFKLRATPLKVRALGSNAARRPKERRTR